MPHIKFIFVSVLSSLLIAQTVSAAGKTPSSESVMIEQQVLAATLLGEMALQRNLYGDAYMALITGAKAGQRAELADRAFQIAKAAKDKKKSEEALSILRSIDPENAHLQIERYKKQLTQGQFKSIPDSFIKKIQSSDSAFELLRELTLLTAKMKDKKSRFEFLASIAESEAFTFHAKTQMMMAYTAAEAKENEKALTYALKGCKLEPSNGQMLLESADYQFAIDAETTKKRLIAFLEKYPNDYNVRLGLARLYAKTQHPKKSLSEVSLALETARQLNGEVAQTLYFAGNIAEENKAFQLAKNYYLDYLQLINGKDNYLPDAAYVRLGVLSLNANNPDKALHYFNLVEKGDQYITAKVKAAEILAERKQIDEACHILKTVKSEDNLLKASLYEGCSKLLFQHKHRTQALKVLDEILGIDPKNSRLLFHVANFALREGESSYAQTLYAKYIKLNPKDPHGYNSLGYLWLDAGIKTKEARPLIEKAYALSAGKDASIVDSMAWLLFREGRFQEAEEKINEALQLMDDPEIRLHKAEILFNLHKKEDAKKLLVPLTENPSMKERALDLLKRFNHE